MVFKAHENDARLCEEINSGSSILRVQPKTLGWPKTTMVWVRNLHFTCNIFVSSESACLRYFPSYATKLP